MAEMLVDGAKLDACMTAEANAIRAKTGGSGQLTYDFANGKGFADEIASIPMGGGGSYEMKLLHETEPTTEQVSAIKVDFTQSMQGYDFYRVVLLGTFTKQPYPYAGFNTETNNKYLNAFSGTSQTNSHWECFAAKAESKYFAVISNSGISVTGDISYFHARAYVADAFFNAGFKVQIWGCNYANS